MTAISATNLPASLIRVTIPSTPRLVEAAVAAVAEAKSNRETTGTAKPVEQASAKSISKEELASQLHELQAKMDKLNPALVFVVDRASGRALIQLTDRSTKEVIQQFPTEAAMQISRALDRFEKGQLVSRTV